MPLCRFENSSASESRKFQSAVARYFDFVNMGFFGVVGGAAAAGESTKVTQAFQPFGRSEESNSS
jgi:hypothetical protein